jgi:hypothetical protein
MHLDIAAGAFLAIPPETYLKTQVLLRSPRSLYAFYYSVITDMTDVSVCKHWNTDR